MRRRFQSLRRTAPLSAAAGFLCLAASGVAAQERPYTTGPIAPPVVVPIEPTRPPMIIPGPRPLPESALPPRPAVITNPSWARQPQPEYPGLALSQGVADGRVTLQCVINPNGTLTNCDVKDETPAGVGFRESALTSVARARVSPRTVDGAAVGARVTFTIRYRAPPVEPLPVPPAPPRR